MTTKARFVVCPGPWGQWVKPKALRSMPGAIRYIATVMGQITGGDVPAREQAECFGAGIIARVIYVPAGEPDDYDGPVVAEVRAGWGLA